MNIILFPSGSGKKEFFNIKQYSIKPGDSEKSKSVCKKICYKVTEREN